MDAAWPARRPEEGNPVVFHATGVLAASGHPGHTVYCDAGDSRTCRLPV